MDGEMRKLARKYTKHIAARLKQIRGKRSQRSFALSLGVHQQNINRYERGTVPSAEFLAILLLKEKVNINWLLTGKGSKRTRS